MSIKTCSKCRHDKPLDAFSASRSTKDGLNYQCKDCHHAWYVQNRDKSLKRAKEWTERNPKRAKTNRLRRDFGHCANFDETMSRYWSATNCELCGGAFESEGPLRKCIDHKNNVIRGIIHDRCNLGIGKLGDSVEGVSKALEYLQRKTP